MNLKKCEQNQIRSKKSRENWKRKIDELDEETRLKITGKKDSSALGRPQKKDNDALIDAISRITISGSAAHEKLTGTLFSIPASPPKKCMNYRG